MFGGRGGSNSYVIQRKQRKTQQISAPLIQGRAQSQDQKLVAFFVVLFSHRKFLIQIKFETLKSYYVFHCYNLKCFVKFSSARKFSNSFLRSAILPVRFVLKRASQRNVRPDCEPGRGVIKWADQRSLPFRGSEIIYELQKNFEGGGVES